MSGDERGELLLVEVKHSRVGKEREREAVRDLLYYFKDLEPYIDSTDRPLRGMVVAWDATGSPKDPGISIQGMCTTTLPLGIPGPYGKCAAARGWSASQLGDEIRPKSF